MQIPLLWSSKDSSSPSPRTMKNCTPCCIAPIIALQVFIWTMAYKYVYIPHSFFSKETGIRESSARHHHKFSPSSPDIPKPTFTCKQNDSAVIDSFGTPCLDLTSFLASQQIFMHDSDNLSYAFCAIPKNGCTYHKAVMHRAMGYPYEGPHNVHDPENVVRLQRAYPKIAELLLSETVPKYVIIRNPMHRVLSAYLNKVESKYKKVSLKTPESFHKWIYEDEALKPGMDWRKRNPHWASQLRFCGFKVRDFSSYFRIFRVEQPVEYVDYMESFLPENILKDGWDMPHNRSFREHVLGPRTRTENTSARFLRYMGNLRTFDYLSEVYREDIELLGYRDGVEKLREELIEYLEDRV